MELEGITLSEISQVEKVSNDFTHLWSIRTKKKKLKEQTSSRITAPKNGLTVTKGKGTEEDGWQERDKGKRGHYN